MKRATELVNFRVHKVDNFNPRPREEGDINSSSVVMFTRYFNPRPREEGDYEERGYFAIGGISIHALVKRATRYKQNKKKPFGHFNPRPREEGDRMRNEDILR